MRNNIDILQTIITQSLESTLDSSVKDLILIVSKFIDEHYEDDIEELEEVLENLMEIYYYTQVNK